MAESDWVDVAPSGSDWVDVESPQQLKPSTVQTLAEPEKLRQEIIQQAQKGAGTKAWELAQGLGKVVVNPVAAIAKALISSPEVFSQPETIIPTGLEAGRRTGMDLVQLGQMLLPNKTIPVPGGNLVTSLRNALLSLPSQTPTQEEIDKQIEAMPLQQALEKARTNVAFEGANPIVAEGLTQALELAPPVKGLQLLKGTAKGLAGVPRLVRTAIKPSKAAMGAKIESATAAEMPEIFHRNPNADKLGATPIEGFAAEVKASLDEAGNAISDLRAQSGTVLNAGDQLATKIEQRAAQLRKSGHADIADEMLEIAKQKRGSMTDINSLQEGVTIANRKPNILRPKTDAQGFVDEIISKEGGNLINQELHAIGGEAGQVARKKWSNLKTLSDNLEERVSKLINNAPAEAQPALLQALASPEGVASVFALFHGWTLPGAITLASKVGRNWLKNEAKLLKDSNATISRTYDTIRKTPYPKPVPLSTVTPPPLPSTAVPPPIPLTQQQIVNQQIAQQLSGTSSVPNIPITGPSLGSVMQQIGGPVYNPATLNESLLGILQNQNLYRTAAQEAELARQLQMIQGSQVGSF